MISCSYCIELDVAREGVWSLRTAAPALFPLFRSELQSKLLLRILLGEGEESVAELASAAGEDPGNTAREVVRLERAGIVTSRRVGRTKLIQANRRAPFYRALVELVTVVLGPAKVLAEELTGIDGIVHAEIFGSWAARYHGEPGQAPSDVDLLVVGAPDRDNLHDATQSAARRLNRPVNPVVVSAQRWNTAEDGFIREVRSRPRVAVVPFDGAGTGEA
jgi:DNA-binding transcriptional ArsR family regulator